MPSSSSPQPVPFLYQMPPIFSARLSGASSVDQSKFSWWTGDRPSTSIQDAPAFSGPTLTEAAKGTSENCTGLSTCLMSAA